MQLDETVRAHLFNLARAADGIPASGRSRRRTATRAVSRLSLRWALEAITDAVAFVRLAITAERLLRGSAQGPIHDTEGA